MNSKFEVGTSKNARVIPDFMIFSLSPLGGGRATCLILFSILRNLNEKIEYECDRRTNSLVIND